MTTFLHDPIVPVELGLPNGRWATLYQPGWYTADDGSTAFLGSERTIYGFGSLDDLAAYVASGASHGLSKSKYFNVPPTWTVAEYADRLAAYDLVHPPELADRHLDAIEQASLGSTIALLLDLLDHAEIEDEHAQALRDDRDVSQLAAGEPIVALFSTGRHRQHVVDLLATHWSSCVAEVARRVSTPSVPEGGSPPVASATEPERSSNPLIVSTDDETAVTDSTPLETVVDAVTVWFGFAEDGLYTIRTTIVDDGHPAYLGDGQSGAGVQLFVWADLDLMRTELRDGKAGKLPGVDLAAATSCEVSLTPHDDCIFDLVEIGASIGPGLGREEADLVVSAWTEVARLAAWGGWTDVAGLSSPDSVIGAFVVSCAIDLAQARPGADRALASADTAPVRESWAELVTALFDHVRVRS